MKFYKYRTVWSWGTDPRKGWTYTTIPDWQTPAEFFVNICERHDFSDKFHGVKYYKVQKPPKEWLEEQIKYARIDLESKRKHLIQLKEAYGATNR